MKHINTKLNITPIQLKLPVDYEKIIKISDPVYSFSEIMAQIDLNQFFTPKERKTGRPEFDRVKLLKIVLFAFMEFGYCSVRQIHKLCETDIRFLWLLDDTPAPSVMTIQNFIHDELTDHISTIFDAINSVLFEQEKVDLNHIYIDGTKLKANAGNYTWVWKKSCIKNRNKTFEKITALLEEINAMTVIAAQAKFDIRQEYEIDYIGFVLEEFLRITGIKTEEFVHGIGHRKSPEQRIYEQLSEYHEKLKRYSKHIKICGERRNSYSKTDHDATFLRVKRDYMGNDQLLPAYNVQVAVADGYIAQYGIYAFASDMDCFQPLMDDFAERYGFYPKYPVADAGYGSYNNYLYCEQHGMEKYMKFTMFDKENKDKKYRNNPFRAVNFEVDENGTMLCPNKKKFYFLRSALVRGNQFGRTQEYYQCEDCEGCTLREQCHKSKDNRVVRVNEELTGFHLEVQENLNSIHGALLRMNRSIQAEGTFGTMKWNRGYSRFRRRGMKGVKIEIGLISCGFNLHKFHNQKLNKQEAA